MKKILMSMGSLVVLFTVIQSVSAAETKIQCTAEGKSLSQNGEGLLNATAKFIFLDTVNRKKERVLKNIEGKFIGYSSYGDYIGIFDIPSLTENAEYRPSKYKGYSQFKKFDAADTSGGLEEGMWGQFVLEKDTSKSTFSAHYIFQAGDHMGGTLHLSCQKI